MKELTTCFGPYWMDHHQVESIISEKINYDVCYTSRTEGEGNDISFYNCRCRCSYVDVMWKPVYISTPFLLLYYNCSTIVGVGTPSLLL
jgi:hypothetical protein